MCFALHSLGIPRSNAFGVASGVAVGNVILARLGADRIFKWLGYSRSRRFHETQAKMLANPEGFVADDEVVEVHPPMSLVRGLIWMCLAFCLVSVLSLILDRAGEVRHSPYPYALIALFGSLAFGLPWTRNDCKARADIEGIFGCPFGCHFRRKMVPWSEIETCELVTHHDTFGNLVLIVPVFKDASGTDVLKLDLTATPIEDQERLVKYIKARLPKSKHELAEL